MTRPSSGCSCLNFGGEQKKKKKNVHFRPCPDLLAFAPILRHSSWHNITLTCTIWKLSPCSPCKRSSAIHTTVKEKKKVFGIDIAAKGRTQRQFIVSFSPFWCNISFFMFLQSISMSASPHEGRKEEKKGTVTLLWISYIPRNTFSRDGILKPDSTESLREAKTKEALSSLSCRSHSHDYATFKCTCASIHTGATHTPTPNILHVPMQGWAELIYWLSWAGAHKLHGAHTHTHTYICCVFASHMWERWRKVGSQQRAPYPLQLIYFATLPPALHLTADLFFSTLFTFLLTSKVLSLFSHTSV